MLLTDFSMTEVQGQLGVVVDSLGMSTDLIVGGVPAGIKIPPGEEG